MSGKAAALVLVCALCAPEMPERVHRHAARGASVPVSLDRVEEAWRGVARRFAEASDVAARLAPDRGFDSGLPACSARRTRRVRTELPAGLVGRTISFAPERAFVAGDLRVATSARSLAGLEADALADRPLSERLDVRCRPTRVRILSEVELELVEGD